MYFKYLLKVKIIYGDNVEVIEIFFLLKIFMVK